jgi:hypothetical protein
MRNNEHEEEYDYHPLQAAKKKQAPLIYQLHIVWIDAVQRRRINIVNNEIPYRIFAT